MPLAVAGIGCRPTSQPTTNASAAPAKSLYVQAAVAYEEGDKDRAAAALRTALERNPDLIMARLLLGTILRDKGDYDAAAKQYERVVELDPYTALNHYNLGLMYHFLNQLQGAAGEYLEALHLKPTDVKSNMNLGLVYTALGHPEQGLPYARKAVELDPRSADAAANLGLIQDSMHDYAAAESTYRRALELDPDRSEAALNLAGCLAAEKKYKEAIAVYEMVLKTKDSSAIRQRYGYALLRAGRIDDAIAQFSAAVKLDLHNYQAYNGLGDAYLEQYRASAMLDAKKRSLAVENWKKSLDLNPNQPRTLALVKEYTDKALFP
jgi:Tfp pilus assembly protein PilF